MKKLLDKIFGNDLGVFIALLSWVSIHCYLFQRALDAIK